MQSAVPAQPKYFDLMADLFGLSHSFSLDAPHVVERCLAHAEITQWAQCEPGSDFETIGLESTGHEMLRSLPISLCKHTCGGLKRSFPSNHWWRHTASLTGLARSSMSVVGIEKKKRLVIVRGRMRAR